MIDFFLALGEAERQAEAGADQTDLKQAQPVKSTAHAFNPDETFWAPVAIKSKSQLRAEFDGAATIEGRAGERAGSGLALDERSESIRIESAESP